MHRKRIAVRLVLLAVVCAATSVALVNSGPCTAGSSAVNVKHYGARGNGAADDTAAFAKAMARAAKTNRRLHVPAGTYRVRRLTLINGVRISGAGMDATWIKGGVTFNSNVIVRDLKIGDLGQSCRNGMNASNVLFERVRFRGGGGTAMQAPIYLGGGRNSCDHVTFRDCLIERNLGDENADRSMNYNNINFIEVGAIPDGSHMDSITFDGCHVGVSNGRTDIPRNIGSPRAGLECYTHDNGDDFAYHGWSNVKVIDCVFEATDNFCIDLADSLDARGEHISGPALISGCTLKGGGYASDRFAYTICLEAPKGVVIENNLIYRGRNSTINVHGSQGVPASGYVIRNNVFALDVDNGITPSNRSMVLLQGNNVSFTGNTITTNRGATVLELQHSTNSTIAGNTLNELRSSTTPWALQIYNVTGATVSGNTFRTAASTDPVINFSGTNTGNTFTDNVFVRQ
jgi:hypothetical protein